MHDGTIAKVWPVKIVVAGTPHGGIAGEVDILSNEYGDFNQMLSWAKPGDTISPTLRPPGFGMFDALMDAVQAVADGRHTTYPHSNVKAWDHVQGKLSAKHQKVIAAAREKLDKLPPERTE